MCHVCWEVHRLRLCNPSNNILCIAVTQQTSIRMSTFPGPRDTPVSPGPTDEHGNTAIEEKPVETEPADISVSQVQVFIESTLVITVIVLSLLLLVLILTRERLRKRAFNQLLVSLALGCFLFSLLVRPGTILDENKHQEMNKGYCWCYLLLQKLEWFFFPLTFWMLAIERLLALHKPETYTKRTRKVAMGLMIGFPWVFALVFAVVVPFVLGSEAITHYGPFPDDPDLDEELVSYFAQINCMMIYSKSSEEVDYILMILFSCTLPVCALGITSITLIVVFFKRRGVKVYDDSGELLVSTESIVLCLIMNISAVIIVLDERVRGSSDIISDFLHLHWAWAVVELIFVLLALFALPDVRHSAAQICCCCCDLRSKDDECNLLVEPTKETQTQDAETPKD